MSWSSEFEPDSNDPTERGRSISFSQQEKQLYQSPQTTQDIARSTLKLSTPEETDSGPSPVLVIGTAVLAAIALLAGLLYLSASGDDDDETSEQASASQAPAGESAESLSLNELVGGFDTTRIAFEPGTTRFTPAGFDALSALRSAVANDPEATLAFDVRTYTEDNPAQNHQLSIKQADVITEFVMEGGGVDASQISARGLGSADIGAGDHLSHFVTISLPESSRSIQNSIADTSGFAFATDPGEWPTDVQSASALQAVVSLTEEEGAEVEIAISTFDEVSESEAIDEDTTQPETEEQAIQTSPELAGLSNKLFVFEANASQLGDSILQLLTNSGVDPSLVSITQSTEPVQVPSGVNNVVSVVSGEQAQLTQSIEEIDDLRFLPGSAELDGNGRNSLDEAAALLADSPETLIVNVHTFSQQTAEDNQALSVAQAQAAVDYLEDQGIPAARLRAIGSGNSNQFDESGRLTLVVLTIAQ